MDKENCFWLVCFNCMTLQNYDSGSYKYTLQLLISRLSAGCMSYEDKRVPVERNIAESLLTSVTGQNTSKF